MTSSEISTALADARVALANGDGAVRAALGEGRPPVSDGGAASGPVPRATRTAVAIPQVSALVKALRRITEGTGAQGSQHALSV
ncbi:hypothetical protein GCM10017772_17620 [Promicromonospora soli]|uniref:Uncharacterized protein n=1 Tax=Promicromonospora soli TaxID=2035533 RepID=A0A919FQG9_9MICO|nr:hypothetical protein GCM10017772_17620 [Promicromonospora soli]